MLRSFALLLLLASTLAFAAPVPKEKPKDTDAIRGQWKFVEIQEDGKPGGASYKTAIVTFDAESMHVKGGVEKGREESIAYKLDADKKLIDLSPDTSNRMVVRAGVYELDGDTLLMALAIKRDGARPKLVKAGPGVQYFKLQRINEEKK